MWKKKRKSKHNFTSTACFFLFCIFFKLYVLLYCLFSNEKLKNASNVNNDLFSCKYLFMCVLFCHDYRHYYIIFASDAYLQDKKKILRMDLCVFMYHKRSIFLSLLLSVLFFWSKFFLAEICMHQNLCYRQFQKISKTEKKMFVVHTNKFA